MNKHTICEAMYALPGDVVVRRRKSPLVPFMLLALGAALLLANAAYGAAWSVNLRSAAVFMGGVLILAGAIGSATRIFGSQGAPYHTGERCFLHYDELYFGRDAREAVMRQVRDGAVDGLLAMPHDPVSTIAVAIYRTKDNRFAAMRAYEYADLEYRPLTELRVIGSHQAV